MFLLVVKMKIIVVKMMVFVNSQKINFNVIVKMVFMASELSKIFNFVFINRNNFSNFFPFLVIVKLLVNLVELMVYAWHVQTTIFLVFVNIVCLSTVFQASIFVCKLLLSQTEIF